MFLQQPLLDSFHKPRHFAENLIHFAARHDSRIDVAEFVSFCAAEIKVRGELGKTLWICGFECEKRVVVATACSLDPIAASTDDDRGKRPRRVIRVIETPIA